MAAAQRSTAADDSTASEATHRPEHNAADIALLTTLLAQQQQQIIAVQSDSVSLSMEDLDIAEELRRIETAHGIAEGMEDRLDGLIGNLDKLLESLQGVAGASNGEPEGTLEGGGEGEREREAADPVESQTSITQSRSSESKSSK